MPHIIRTHALLFAIVMVANSCTPDVTDLSSDAARCHRGSCTCTATTCAAQGEDCGTISDGCGHTLDCGSCVSPQTCGGDGVPNVCGGDPGTCAAGSFGSCTAGASAITASGDYKRVSPFTLAAAAVNVTSLTAYVDGLGAATGTQNVRGIVYAADGAGGDPGTLVCATTELVVTAGMPAAWRELPMAGSCTLGSTGTYYLGLLTSPTAGVLSYYGTPVTDALRHDGDAYADGPSNPFGTPAAGDVELSVYASYEPSSCTPTSCAAQHDNCGTISDGCGGMLACGSCTAPQSCGGGGTPNVCGGASGITCSVTVSPGAAIDSVFDALAPGDVLCLHSGHYGSPTTWTTLARSGTPGHPITLTTVPGESPATIEGAFTVGGNSPGLHQSYVTVSHLDFNLDYVMAGGRVNGTSVGCNANNVMGVQLNGGNLTFEYNELSEAGVAAQYRDTALGVNFVSGEVEPGIVIRNNKIHDYGACDHFDHGIYLDFISSGEISGNWIWNPGCSYGAGGGDHSRGCGAGIQLWVAPTGLAIHGNVIDGTGLGFYYSGSNNSIYNNVIANLRGMYGATGNVESAAAYGGYAGSSTNTFHDNDLFNAGALCNDCTATSSSNVTVDPLFTDPATHDYTLRSGSPVAGYGLWNGAGR